MTPLNENFQMSAGAAAGGAKGADEKHAAASAAATSPSQGKMKPCTCEIKRHEQLTAQELKELRDLKHDGPSLLSLLPSLAPRLLTLFTVTLLGVAVFVVNRGVEERFFYDTLDPECEHVLFRVADSKQLIGTAR